MADRPSPDPLAPPPEKAARLFEEAAGEPSLGAARTPPPSPAEIAPSFPDLEILDVIGAGGMGVVYRARHRRLERLVALKVLPRELAADAQFAERFAREARTLARLDHPRIVRVHDFGQSGGLYFLVLEYVEGANLRQVMAAGRLSARDALAIVPQICEALQYAHDQGVVHRDIKPENVLLDARGRVKIADFGLAKIVGKSAPDATLTNAGQVMGTFQYMAPEQYRTPGEVDHRADLFSLGVVFYEMLTGELPVGRFEPPSQAVALDDARIDRIVLRALERERDRRYQRADDIRTDVTRLSSPGTAPAPATSARPGAAPDPKAGRRALLLSLLALPLAIAAFALVHEGWGGVIRGTDDAAEREIWKGVAGGVFLILGAGAGIVAAARGAAVARRGFIHKAGMTLALLYAAGVVVLLVVVGVEVAEHSRTPAGLIRGQERGRVVNHIVDRPPVSRDARADDVITLEVTQAWERFAKNFRDRGTSWETVADAYSPEERERLLAVPFAARGPKVGGLGLGPRLLDWDPPLADHRVMRVEPTGDPDRVLVSVRHREAPIGSQMVRFPMQLDEGRWYLAIGPVEIVQDTTPR